MTFTRKKRPRDPLQLCKIIVDIATGQIEDREDDGKDVAAVLGRRGGLRGGRARADALTPREEKRIGQEGCGVPVEG